jgi:ketosteroid isomerase-like protein
LVSAENIEIARRYIALANERGPEAMEVIATLFHPDAEARDLQPAPGTPEVMHGRAAIVAVWKQWLEALDDWRIEVHEYVDADPWLVCDVHWHATGKGSDVPIDWRLAEAHEFRDGQIVRSIFGYPDVASAIDGLDLSDRVGRH